MCRKFKKENSETLIYDLDQTLNNLGVGPYQFKFFFLMGLMLVFSNISPLNHIMYNSDLKYRCLVPQCDVSNNLTYNAEWLKFTVPFYDNKPSECAKYPLSKYGHQNAASLSNDTCQPYNFDTRFIEPCDKWVFDGERRTIVNDFGLMCRIPVLMLSFLGYVNNISQIIGTLVTGLLSDLFGRKGIIAAGLFSSAILGTLQSFSNDYYSFLLSEIFNAMASGGIHGIILLLSIEQVPAQGRAMTITIMSCFYMFGMNVVDIVAYFTVDWRTMLRVLYLPGFLLILFFIRDVPESVRWLHTRKEYDRMLSVLSRISESNHKNLNSCLVRLPTANGNNKSKKKANERHQFFFTEYKLETIISLKMALRLFCCMTCWMVIVVIFHGLPLISIPFNNNDYASAIQMNIMCLMTCMVSYPAIKILLRRKNLIYSLLLTGAGCFLVNYIPAENPMAQKSVLMLCRIFITFAFINMLVYTAELFPTKGRMTLFGLFSALGRIGLFKYSEMTGMTNEYGHHAMCTLFGIMALWGLQMTLFLPETKDNKLPDTMEEIENDDDIIKNE